jgi:hypothetical protein
MATLQENYDTGITASCVLYDDTDVSGFVYHEGQTFTSAAGFTIASAAFKLYKTGNGAGNITLTLYAADGSHHPTGAALATSAVVNSGAFTTNASGAWVVFTFGTTYACAAATEYCLVLTAPDGDASNLVQCLYDAAGATYTGGGRLYSSDGGASYTWYSGADMGFRTYGTSALGSGTAPADKTYSKELVAFADNEVWREAVAGTMSEVTDARGDIDTSEPLSAVAAFQKVFIVNGTNFKVLDLVNTKITTNDISSGANLPPGFGTKLTGGTSGAEMIVDYIDVINGAGSIYGKRTTAATFSSGETVTGTNATGTPYAGAVSLVTSAAEVSAPHWYTWTVYGGDAANYGTMPDKAYNVCRYRGRLQITADPNLPHQWYQTRQKNPFDFLFVAGDAQSPVAGNDTDCGEVGDIVRVGIPYHDDYLIYGCANELWYLSGDAAFGGELNILDENSGILGDRAWCWDGDKRLYLLCTSGLLRIPVGFQSIENLTAALWPNWVKDLAFDSSLHRIVLAFNPEDHGIHIFKTVLATGVSATWWYDLRTEGLFPDSIPDTMGVYCAQYYQTASPSYRKLLFGCADGYIRFMDPSTHNDDSTAIDSYVGFAPLRLSTHPRKDGKLTNVDIVTGGGGSGGTETDSSDVYCQIHVARTAAEIKEKLDAGTTPKMTKTFSAPGHNKGNLDRRSVRGQWSGIKLGNSTAAQSWSMERLIIDTKEVGRSL